jgi:hypothetical protein
VGCGTPAEPLQGLGVARQFLVQDLVEEFGAAVVLHGSVPDGIGSATCFAQAPGIPLRAAAPAAVFPGRMGVTE